MLSQTVGGAWNKGQGQGPVSYTVPGVRRILALLDLAYLSWSEVPHTQRSPEWQQPPSLKTKP